MYDYYDYGYSSSVGTAVSAATLASIISTYSIFVIAFYVALVVAQWKIFVKAGEEGWKAIIPIYNVIILYKISGLSPWLLLLFLLIWVPVVGWIISVTLGIVSMVKLGKAFNKSTGFIIGLIFLTPIFEMILGFGSAQYVGPATKTSQNDVNNN